MPIWIKTLANSYDRLWHICDAQRMAPMSDQETFDDLREAENLTLGLLIFNGHAFPCLSCLAILMVKKISKMFTHCLLEYMFPTPMQLPPCRDISSVYKIISITGY